MLAIRLQRQGHKGHAVYRVIIQDAKHSPKSGKIVAYVGFYNPHTKENKLDVEKITEFLNNGAQPSPRVVKLLIENKVKLPNWVEKPKTDRTGKIKNSEKLRKNQPKEDEKPTESLEEAKTEPKAEPSTSVEDSGAGEAPEGENTSNTTPEAEQKEEVTNPVEQAEDVVASEESEEKSEEATVDEKPVE